MSPWAWKVAPVGPAGPSTCDTWTGVADWTIESICPSTYIILYIYIHTYTPTITYLSTYLFTIIYPFNHPFIRWSMDPSIDASMLFFICTNMIQVNLNSFDTSHNPRHILLVHLRDLSCQFASLHQNPMDMGLSENSVAHCTQWFCWSLSLWKMASYHWDSPFSDKPICVCVRDLKTYIE